MEKNRKAKLYSLGELYDALVKISRSFKSLLSNRKNNQISPDFMERLMLAVTEVNGCDVCAYEHTKMALSQGFTQAEITAFLNGSDEYIKAEEMKAILFAQHYADTKGKIDFDAYQQIVSTYGHEKTNIILATIQMMMVGNIVGLPISAFKRRLKGTSDMGSTLMHELGLPLSTVILVIPAFIHGWCKEALNRPKLNFDLTSKGRFTDAV